MVTLKGKYVRIKYNVLSTRLDDMNFSINNRERKISYMKKYGIKYRPFHSYDIIEDDELFSLFLLEHGDIIDINPYDEEIYPS